MNEDDETEDEPLGNLVDGVGDDGDGEGGAPPETDAGDRSDEPGAAVDPGGLPDESRSKSDPAESEPLGNLADRIDERRGRGDPEEDLFDRAFDDVGVEEADTESLWEDLESGSLETPVEEPAVETEGETYIVDKREYCLRCQHFSDPPDVRCDATDSEIVEVSDTENFRVRGCPIVTGEEDLQNVGR